MLKLIKYSILATMLFFLHGWAHADAQQVEFLIAGVYDISGDPLPGAIVVTRNAANSAAKAVWEDKDQTLPSGLGKSQFVLDAEAKATVFGDGIYTIIIYAAADVGLTSPLYTFSGVTYENSATLRADLADNSSTLGSDLVAHTGTARTVTETLDGYSDGTVALALPTITSFAGSTHTHTDDANGGATLTTPTIDTPVIDDFTSATHDHTDDPNGGTLPASSFGFQSVQVFVASYPISAPTLAIGTTKTDIASAAFDYLIDGVQYAKGAVAAGTPPGTDEIPQNTYGAVALDIDAAGAITVAEATDNTTGYASAALAISGIPAVAVTKVRMGTVTVTRSDDDFEFGTDDLDITNSTVVYTDAQLSGATWTKPDGINNVLVEVVGGGGNGGASDDTNSDGSGGGGGGAAIKFIDVTAISSETVTIGAAAGTSSFGSHCSATGGATGLDGTSPLEGGDGGIGSDGDINLGGADGANAGGGGAAGWFGGGGGGEAADAAGRAGKNYGGGGAGGDITGANAGGAGASGIVVVFEYK